MQTGKFLIRMAIHYRMESSSCCLGAGCVVSYGTSHRDALTFSSLEGNRLSLAVQRELVTLDGCVVDRQEIPLPLPSGWDPQLLLSAAGVLLLSGFSPEALRAALPV